MARMDQLFRALVQAGGSDLHLTAGEIPRIRVDGDMKPLGKQAITPQQMTSLLQEITPEANWAEFEETSDTDFAYPLPGVARFRANLFADINGMGGVFRVIPSEILSAEKLGLPESILNLCRLHKGLVLVTGPTGSGKSTTLAAIDYINASRDDHIITIEDPVEFVHPQKRCLVNQREVGNHTVSFKTALRAALREDPDIILLGELRDLETIHIALEMAETGHLVFGTLHTNTAASTVDRIIDQFPSEQQPQIRTMLASSLKGVVSQTLLKKKDGGRVAAMEILLVTSGVAANIREGKTHQIPMAMQTGGKLGMKELNAALLELVKDDKVDPEQALAKAIDKDGLARSLQRFGLGPQAEPPATAGAPGGATPTTVKMAVPEAALAQQRRAGATASGERPAARSGTMSARVEPPGGKKKSRWFQ
jgi:twitching motility protein PilT